LKFSREICGSQLLLYVVIGSACCGFATTHLFNNSLPEIQSFGLNSTGQLGSKNHDNGHISKLKSGVVAVASGRAHMLVLTTNEIFAAGSNIQGQCGLEKAVKFSDGYQVPRIPFHATDVRQICCGLDNSLILTKDGEVFTTGLGADGQTGTGAHNCQYGFEQVAGDIIGHRVVQISATTDTCLALTDRGCMFGWGNNEKGQISESISDKQIAIPVEISTPKKLSKVSQVFAGGSFTSLIEDKIVYVKGFGALGLGHKHFNVNEFTKVDIDKSLGKVVILSGSTDYQAALTDTGKLLTWGRGNHGRLGQGNKDDCFFPKEVELPGRVCMFTCGVDHMIALVRTGTNP